MTSMLCDKQPGGQVKVHDSELTGKLMDESHDHFTNMLHSSKKSSMKRSARRPHTTPSPTRNMDSSSLIGQTMRVQHWLNEKQVKNLQFAVPYIIAHGLQEKSDLESRSARNLYSPLLETEGSFVKDVDHFLTERDVLTLRKKEVLHKKWNERVFKPLRKKIIHAMDGSEWPEVDRRKRELHKQYLEFTNEKGHVFLDTMDPSEYYAMALNGDRPAPIKGACRRCAEHTKSAFRRLKVPVQVISGHRRTICVETRPLRDPLLSQGRDRYEEDRTILRCVTGQRYSDRDIEQVKLPTMPLVPLGRHGTDSVRWLEMPLSNIESTPRMASRRKMHGIFNNTEVDFDAWSKIPYDPAIVDKELNLQKKRMYAEDQKPPFQAARQPRLQLKPGPRNVSFQEPVLGEEAFALEALNHGLQQIGVGV